jgi:hypothetical protein
MTSERNEAPFSLWSFLRSVLSQGADIHLDHQGKGYELHSARLDEAAREREEQLTARLQPARVPEGWKMVPREPTKGMLLAGVNAGVNASPDPWCPKAWAAMLAAAPAPEADAKVSGDEMVTLLPFLPPIPRRILDAAAAVEDYMRRHHPGPWSLFGIRSVQGYANPAPEAPAAGQGEGVEVEELAQWCDEQSEDPDNADGAVTLLVIAQTLRRLASAQQAGIPAMDDEVRWILGQPNFACISYANALRRLGHSIPNKVEEEQAAVIHWMLTVYAQHGESWREEGAKILRGQRTGSRGEVGNA